MKVESREPKSISAASLTFMLLSGDWCKKQLVASFCISGKVIVNLFLYGFYIHLIVN